MQPGMFGLQISGILQNFIFYFATESLVGPESSLVNILTRLKINPNRKGNRKWLSESSMGLPRYLWLKQSRASTPPPLALSFKKGFCTTINFYKQLYVQGFDPSGDISLRCPRSDHVTWLAIFQTGPNPQSGLPSALSLVCTHNSLFTYHPILRMFHVRLMLPLFCIYHDNNTRALKNKMNQHTCGSWWRLKFDGLNREK